MDSEAHSGSDQTTAVTDPSSSKIFQQQMAVTEPSSSSTELSDLPPEMITEILFRLPVKSMGRCCCVSKDWHSTIASPYFVKNHLTIFRPRPQNLLICFFYDEGMCLAYCPLKSVLLRDHQTESGATGTGRENVVKAIPTVEIEYEPFHEAKCIDIVGCQNGLFCLKFEGVLLLWNPCTKKHKLVPDLNDFAMKIKKKRERKTKKTIYKDRDTVYGFLYDETSDDYEVVAVSVSSDVMVYSARLNSWRSIGNLQFGLPLECGNCVSLNGKVHWLSAENGLHVVFLDLAEQFYGFLDSPLPGNREVSGSEVKLGNLGECLCLVHSDSYSKVENVWVMKEYGVGNSWTTVLSMPVIDPVLSTPLFTLEDGSLLLVQDTSFVICDPKGGSSWFPKFEVDYYVTGGGGSLYVESLVSP